MGVQLLIRVDLIAMLFGKLVRHAQRLAVGHQQHAHGRQHHRQIGRERHLRECQRGQPLRQRAHDLHAIVAVEIQRRAQCDGAEQHHQAGRDLLVPTRQQEEHCQRGGSHGKSDPVGLRQLLDDPQQLLHRVALRFGHPEELVELSHGDKNRQAGHEAVHHRFGQELGDEAQPRDPGRQKDQPGDQDEGRRVGLIGFRIGSGGSGRRHQRRRHRRGEQRGRGRGGLHHQMARRAEYRVDEQGGQQRIEAGLRRQAGDARIGHRLRHHQSPQRQTGDDVDGSARSGRSAAARTGWG